MCLPYMSALHVSLEQDGQAGDHTLSFQEMREGLALVIPDVNFGVEDCVYMYIYVHIHKCIYTHTCIGDSRCELWR